MGYIFVYTNSEYEGYVGIGFGEDGKKEVEKLNDDPNILGSFSFITEYEVNNRTDYDRFIKILLGLIPNAEVKKSNGETSSYFNIQTENIIKALDNFVVERSGNSKPISSSSSNSSSSKKRSRGRPKKIDSVKASADSKLSKEEAIDYIVSCGYVVHKSNCTFASKGPTANSYWANPYLGVLDYDWTIILDDTILKKYYVFDIPYGSINSDELKVRADMPHRFNIKIKYNDAYFTDIISKYEFLDFQIAEVKYPSNESINETRTFDDYYIESVPSKTKTKKKVYIDDTEHSDRKATLVNIDEVRYAKPYKASFLGKDYDVDSWKDILGIVFQGLYYYYPSIIGGLADRNASPKEHCKVPYISRDEDLIVRYHSQIPHTNIYYLTNLNSDEIVDFMRYLLKQCNIGLDKLTIWYY